MILFIWLKSTDSDSHRTRSPDFWDTQGRIDAEFIHDGRTDFRFDDEIGRRINIQVYFHAVAHLRRMSDPIAFVAFNATFDVVALERELPTVFEWQSAFINPHLLQPAQQAFVDLV